MEKEFKDIKSFLGNEGVDFRFHVHEPVYTPEPVHEMVCEYILTAVQ
jgi:hypothetical protein